MNITNVKCPECGSLGPFSLKCRAYFGIGKKASFLPSSDDDIYYDSYDMCLCDDCAYEGILKDFIDAYEEDGEG